MGLNCCTSKDSQKQTLESEPVLDHKQIKSSASFPKTNYQDVMSKSSLLSTEITLPGQFKEGIENFKNISVNVQPSIDKLKKIADDQEAALKRLKEEKEAELKKYAAEKEVELKKIAEAQTDKLVPTEYKEQYELAKQVALSEDPEGELKKLAEAQADKLVPAEYKEQYELAKKVALSEDPEGELKKLAEAQADKLVPAEYKEQYELAKKQAKEVSDKAQELKRQKDEMQITMFEKALDQVWHNVDPENTGKIGADQVIQIIKMGLEKAGKSEYYQEDLIKAALEGQEGLSKREVATIMNRVVFGGF